MGTGYHMRKTTFYPENNFYTNQINLYNLLAQPIIFYVFNGNIFFFLNMLVLAGPVHFSW